MYFRKKSPIFPQRSPTKLMEERGKSPDKYVFANIPTKEPGISAKEPYTPAQKPYKADGGERKVARPVCFCEYSHKRAMYFCKKSPIFRQRSPTKLMEERGKSLDKYLRIFPQKSHVFLQKSPIFPQKSPTKLIEERGKTSDKTVSLYHRVLAEEDTEKGPGESRGRDFTFEHSSHLRDECSRGSFRKRE